MRSPWSLAEERAEQSEDPARYLLAFNAGWQVALSPDIDAEAHRLLTNDAVSEAGWVEGVTARRAHRACGHPTTCSCDAYRVRRTATRGNR
ncbi:hypothetical protein [Streptomyces sp. NPDC058373]|uniref:hypothetical protein n=1 Tax=Streptomyces sp. NPDC058373 TaxID=3346465 RepID=UPI00365AC5E3